MSRCEGGGVPAPKARPAVVIDIVMSSSFFCIIERFEPCSSSIKERGGGEEGAKSERERVVI